MPAGKRFVIGSVGKKRPRADCRVQLSGGVSLQRQKTERRIESPGGKTQERILPFRCVATGITSIRCRNNRLYLRQKSNGKNREDYLNYWGGYFHKRSVAKSLRNCRDQTGRRCV